MVLQDLGDVPSEGFGDNPYPSDNDPYSSASPASRPFDASQLPQPLPVLGPFLGFSERLIRFKTETTIKFAERRVGRGLSAEEAQALAFHLYKMEQSKSYFAAAGLSLGIWRWYTTMAISRYPFYKPKPEDINPNKFMFVKGPAAHWARHSWRFLLYGFVAGQMGKLMGQIFAQPLAARDTATDPKLAGFANDLKGAIAVDNQKMRDATAESYRRTGRNPDGTPMAKNPDGTPQQALPPHAGAPRPWGSPRRAPAPVQVPAEDDSSPTAGNDPWASSSAGSYGDSSFSPDPTNGVPDQPQTQPTSTFSQPHSRPADDDASPTGGLFQDEVQSQAKPGESAWERLRRAGGGPPGQRPPPRKQEPPYRQQSQGSTVGDSFAFSGSDDEERKRSREQAQREFDERIERERQGKDFNEEKRW